VISAFVLKSQNPRRKINMSDMTPEYQKERLELGMQLPVATVEGLKLQLPDRVTEEEVNAYLSDFAAPNRECWLCGDMLIVDWDIMHGETFCTSCGIPSRTRHYIKHGEETAFSFDRTLQYHPKNFSLEEDE
jgi:hypothetical protein